MYDLRHAKLLFEMANKDVRALKGMLVDRIMFDDEIFGFHAQQTIEKSLKSWIALLGKQYPLTHNLELYCRRLRNLDILLMLFGIWWNMILLESFFAMTNFLLMIYLLIENSLLKELRIY